MNDLADVRERTPPSDDTAVQKDEKASSDLDSAGVSTNGVSTNGVSTNGVSTNLDSQPTRTRVPIV
jgi:hypothetical protein